MENLCTATARELIARMKQGEFTTEELTRAYLERIEKYDHKLHVIAELDPTAIAQARRLDACGDRSLPLFGLPILIKDNIDVSGLHTTAGSLALNDNVAAADAPVVAALRRAGAVILGKTNMTEFANYTTQGMPNGYSSRGGQVIGAYAPDMNPGGSSTGSGVAVSAGLCAAAIGTDTMFSVVGCAAQNGITGLKPPIGALSADGIVPICHTMDSAGPLTRDLADALLIYSCMGGADFGDLEAASVDGLRIAINKSGWDDVSEQQKMRYKKLLGELERDGAVVCDAHHTMSRSYRNIMSCEFKADLDKYLAGSQAKLKTLGDIIEFYRKNPEKMMRYGIVLLENAMNPDEALYREALADREVLKAAYAADFENYDVCIMTVHCGIFHVCGMPSLALRLGMGDDGLPLGIILYGANERKLYAAALAIEKYCEPITPPELD